MKDNVIRKTQTATITFIPEAERNEETYRSGMIVDDIRRPTEEEQSFYSFYIPKGSYIEGVLFNSKGEKNCVVKDEITDKPVGLLTVRW